MSCRRGSAQSSARSEEFKNAMIEKQDIRLEILASYDQHISAGGSSDDFFIDDAWRKKVSVAAACATPTLSLSTIRRWRSLLKKNGVAGLTPRYKGKRSVLDSSPAMQEILSALLLARWPHISSRQIEHTLKNALPGASIPSTRSIQRWVATWVKDNKRQISAVSNPDQHRSRMQPAFGSAGGDVKDLNQLWELDSTRIDLICSDGRRHSLIAAIDVYSRRAMCVVAPQSNAQTVATLIRQCVIEWGAPAMIVTDEGSDYTSIHIRRALADIGTVHHVLPPYSPEKKPYIERFIGTISRGLFSQLPGFVGHDVSDREALRSRKSFADRRGKSNQVAVGSLSAEELQTTIDTWCKSVYERAVHYGIGQSPFDRARESQTTQRTIDQRALDVLLSPPANGGDGNRTVSKKGISVDGQYFIAPEIGALVGQRVSVRVDPVDRGIIYVFDLSTNAFICVAQDPERTGADRQKIATEARSRARRHDAKSRIESRDLIEKVQPDMLTQKLYDESKRQAEKIIAFPGKKKARTSSMIEAATNAATAAIDKRTDGNNDKNQEDKNENDVNPFMKYYLGD